MTGIWSTGIGHRRVRQAVLAHERVPVAAAAKNRKYCIANTIGTRYILVNTLVIVNTGVCIPIVTAGGIAVIPDISRLDLAGKVSGLHLLIYGFLIMVIAVFQPAGLMGLVQRYRRRG